MNLFTAATRDPLSAANIFARPLVFLSLFSFFEKNVAIKFVRLLVHAWTKVNRVSGELFRKIPPRDTLYQFCRTLC